MSKKTLSSAIFSFGACSIILWFCFVLRIGAQDLMCCSQATGSCRSVCEKVSLVELAADVKLRNETIIEIQKYCSSQLNSFWECLNATFKDMARGDSWPGRLCCPIPYSESCRRACITATSHFDLPRGCRQSDEIAFFSCLERQQAGAECCNSARNENCKQSCVEIFRSELSPNKFQRQKLIDHCEHDSPKVTECIKDMVKYTPVKTTQKHLMCCDKSNNIKCREACKKVLSTRNTMEEIMDGLQLGGCGFPMPQEYFWQCFLKPDASSVSNSVEVSRIERVGMDSAKWHCCQRANSSQCSRLCSKTFTKFWATSWEDFHYKCLTQVTEESLRSCIDEVDEPCELGCDGLSFCTNFNNRPTELFRSCTSQADEEARNNVAKWQNQNNITLTPGLTLPLKSMSKCSPNIWKTVACTLQIKPCSRASHANQICRNVCLDILSQCVDWTRVSPEYSAESICETLSPEDPDDSCVELDHYLTPSSYEFSRITGQVFSPCKGNPCEANEICLLNRNCMHGMNCKPYLCQPGCKLGEVSQYMVPDKTLVRIPIPNNPKGCLKICKCNKNNIEECQPLLCVTLTSCLLGNTHQLHGTIFNMDCNQCSCYAGEIICSKKQCESTALSGRNTAYTTLPCNCPPHYVPICGRNGVTYPSACLAKCADLNDADIEHYPCQNPCKPDTCPVGQKCVPNSQVCLSLMHKPCKQYECINGSSDCSLLPKDPVCDIENREYENSCLLSHHNAKLAYRGPCLTRCRHKGQVCGFNGKTYISECAAFADMVAVDYEGPCVAIGLITTIKSKQCSGVKCPKLHNKTCMGITPPGACCPICGGALRLLYSRKQIDRALYALQNRSTKSLNLYALLKALERQIQLAQCTLKGYLTVELDIFVAVQSTERYPSELQLEACLREAEKIASLVNMQSPRVASELSLSSLTAASIVHTDRNGSVRSQVDLKWLFWTVLVTILVEKLIFCI
ncbi:reversion-inducing-cysteine-rich protein with kazal motifs [Leptinotarsa decemlineata]|uniref:reversion-inducing-cysteine-rich protein with kazal motifs n=1 Tax=Leptinotarsa decemlineata TaxID=7539 RepID=UPI003D308B25